MRTSIPTASALRMNYVDNVYGNLLGNTRIEVQIHQIWVGVDETTDARKRYVANVVIGDFSTEKVYFILISWTKLIILQLLLLL